MIIDIDKFVVSLIKHYCEAYDIDRTFIKCWFDDALEEQGLEYKNGEIVKTQRRVAAEAKEAIFNNEDERIRKRLLTDFSILGKEEWGGLKVKDICAWLEKQGEQKPILDFKASNWYVSKVDGKIHDMTYNPTDKKELKKLTQSVTKTSEQDKPIVLTDTEKKMFDNLISYINNRKGLLDEIKILYTDWLKSLKDRLKGE